MTTQAIFFSYDSSVRLSDALQGVAHRRNVFSLRHAGGFALLRRIATAWITVDDHDTSYFVLMFSVMCIWRGGTSQKLSAIYMKLSTRSLLRRYRLIDLWFIDIASLLWGIMVERLPTQILPQQMAGSMIDMIVGETGHGEVGMIVAVLPPHVHFSLALRRFLKVLGEELALLVEIVRCALPLRIPC